LPRDPFRDLRDDRISQASQTVYPRSQRFWAFLRPNSLKHSDEQVLCFVEWRGRNGLEQAAQFFIAFKP
jgi:hypothetical protein